MIWPCSSITRANVAVRGEPIIMALTFVPTPLGNLRDITLRSLDALRDAALIVAEDSRVARRLLSAYEIGGKEIWTYHEHNAQKATAAILERAKTERVAVVTDAGDLRSRERARRGGAGRGDRDRGPPRRGRVRLRRGALGFRAAAVHVRGLPAARCNRTALRVRASPGLGSDERLVRGAAPDSRDADRTRATRPKAQALPGPGALESPRTADPRDRRRNPRGAGRAGPR